VQKHLRCSIRLSADARQGIADQHVQDPGAPELRLQQYQAGGIVLNWGFLPNPPKRYTSGFRPSGLTVLTEPHPWRQGSDTRSLWTGDSQHIDLCGRYECTKALEVINIAAIIQALVQAPVPHDLAL
jgi:hypothetical protein